MPLQKLQFRPGVNRESTTLANEGGWFESDKVRFRSGFPEKIGGWVKDTGGENTTTPNNTFVASGTVTALQPTSGSFWGVCRALFNWFNLSGYDLLGLGTNLKYYIQNGFNGTFYDVTPIRDFDTGVANAFTTSTATNSGGKTTVTINDAGNGAQAGDFVSIIPLNTTLNGTITSSATSIVLTSATGFPSSGSIFIDSECITYSGISTNTLTGCVRGTNGTTAAAHTTGATVYAAPNGVLVNGEYQIVTYISSSSYTILVTGTATASSTPAVSASFYYQLTTGSDVYTTSVGWGAGGWGGTTTGYSSTGWGSAAPAGLGIGVQLRLWSQSNFGQDLIINPRGGAMYYWAVNSSPSTFDRAQIIKASTAISIRGSTVTPDSTCPSLVNMVMVSDASRFVIALGTNDPSGVLFSTAIDPLLIRWSDQESVATWTPDVDNQAGSYRLSQGSEIITGLQTRQEILIWTDAAIYSMQYLGAPYVWGFQIMGSNISIISPNAAAVANNVTYWMGTDKFYMYSGRVETLPCTLRQYVFDDINLDQAYQFFAGTNEGYNEVWWFYCSAGSDTIDRYVIFNHLERTWYYGTMERTAWTDSPLRDYPMAAGYSYANFTGSISGTTLTVSAITAGGLGIGSTITGDGIPSSTTITALGTGTGGVGTYTINSALTISSRSMIGIPAYSGGSLIYHEFGVDDGTTNPPSPIVSYCQSSDFDIGDGHNFGIVWRIIPDVTFDGSTVNNPTTVFTVRPRQNPGSNYGDTDNPDVVSAQNYQNQQTYNVQQFTQYAYVRIRGRQMAFKISSDGLGVAWQLGTPRLDVRPDGRR